MSCCGRGTRTGGAVVGEWSTQTRRRHRENSPRQEIESVYFRYVGDSSLLTYGPISGRAYRFNGPNTVVAVDRRDRRSLDAVPKLRRV